MSRSTSTYHCEVAVIGAGPYGLAVSAHLKASNIDTMVFGDAMSFWRQNMPQGMKLRSPWQGTHIADPNDALSLEVYDSAGRMQRTEPVPLNDFISYGRWFQRRAVRDLDTRKVARVETASRGFTLTLEDGDNVHARRVVMAMGLANQDYWPSEFNGLSADVVSHTCAHDDLARFRGKHVAVIGRGQSACESAVLLKEAGAEVEIVCRGDIHWLGAPSANEQQKPLRFLRELMAAPSAVGPFPLNWVAELPGLVHRFPTDMRTWFSARSLRAGAAGWLLPRFDGVRTNAGRTILGARMTGDRIELQLDNGRTSYDHVLLATGYRIDISKLGILAPGLLQQIERIESSPRLSVGLESSVPGLHFVGSSAVKSFGPLMRFVAGSGYAARAVTRAVLAGHSRQPAVSRIKLPAASKLAQRDSAALGS